MHYNLFIEFKGLMAIGGEEEVKVYFTQLTGKSKYNLMGPHAP